MNAEKESHTITFGCYLNLFLGSIFFYFFPACFAFTFLKWWYPTERFLNVCTKLCVQLGRQSLKNWTILDLCKPFYKTEGTEYHSLINMVKQSFFRLFHIAFHPYMASSICTLYGRCTRYMLIMDEKYEMRRWTLHWNCDCVDLSLLCNNSKNVVDC